MKRNPARSGPSIEFAESQRQTANEFAATVWQWLRNRQCCGLKFRREFPIPLYTVDFCCVELRLVIEVDGQTHGTLSGREHDGRRDRFLNDHGYQVLRINGYDVIREDGGALNRIHGFVKATLDAKIPSPPAPLPERGEGSQKATVPL